MNTKRAGHGSCLLDNNIFVFGGFNENFETLNSCEMLINNNWINLQHMNTARFGFAFVVFQGYAWAIGGDVDFSTTLNSVEMYNPTLNEWSYGTPMLSKRKCPVATVVGLKLGNFFENDQNRRSSWQFIRYQIDKIFPRPTSF